MKNSTFVDRLFAVFDENGDGAINFAEFLTILSVLSTKASAAEKLEVSFKIYDMDGDGKIGRDELNAMLRATADEHNLVRFHAQPCCCSGRGRGRLPLLPFGKMTAAFQNHSAPCPAPLVHRRPPSDARLPVFFLFTPLASLLQVMNEAELASVIDATFAELPECDGKSIDLASYSSLVESHPMMLSQLTLNISSLVADQAMGK